MQLTAGKLTMQYENGFLRYISAGNDEVLRMIYFAVRDKDWNTVDSSILNEKIMETEAGFFISYDRHFEQDGIRMNWQVSITGKEDSTIRFDIEGKALCNFEKNRAGFCILHPIKECAGRTVKIIHPNGSTEERKFPKYISPHQPFKDISGMEWKIGNEGCRAALRFLGEVFETEDQRNWTDNSYKTYCTPLDFPFPALLQENEKVAQTVVLSLDACIRKDQPGDPGNRIIYCEDDRILLPSIGIGRSDPAGNNYLENLQGLSGIRFGHYRVDIKPSAPGWEKLLRDALYECRLMETKLELALFLPDPGYREIEKFLSTEIDMPCIKSIILLAENGKCIRNTQLEKTMPLFRHRFPLAEIGAGTDYHFTELNRSGLRAAQIDFVAYPVSPQVHAFDDASLVENAEAQGFTTRSAKRKFKKPVHVSPVTLKPRPAVDARQPGSFCARWTIASIKYLTEGGASSITYFETLGEKGISAKAGHSGFPVLAVFKEILSGKWTHIMPSESAKPFCLTSLILQNNQEKIMILVNHTNTRQHVSIMGYSKKRKQARPPLNLNMGPESYKMLAL